MLEHLEIKRKKAIQEKITIQLEEIDQKIQAKEGRLKRYRQRVKQYIHKRILKKTKENSTKKCEEMTRKYTNNQTQEKPNDFGLKYGNQENIMKNPNRLTI